MRSKLVRLVLVAMILAGFAVYRAKQRPVVYTDVHPEIAPIEPVMVDIPGGIFTMGDDARGRDIERPAHQVELTAFRLGAHEVTNEEFKRFCDATGRPYPPDPDWVEVNPVGKDYFVSNPKYPVIMITWSDMAAYCKWLSDRSGKDYHLPTEAQFERAERGGVEGQEYPWGNERDPDKARIYRTWSDGTTEVGTYPPNPYGLYDIAGNVAEATGDWYDEHYYARSPRKDPLGPSGLANYGSLISPWLRSRLKGRCHVVRGGSYRAPWDGVMIGRDGRPELSAQTFGRDWLYQAPYTHFDLGFRVAEGGVWKR
jgi:formylglycine-generating enzyme required for sulfatase activity